MQPFCPMAPHWDPGLWAQRELLNSSRKNRPKENGEDRASRRESKGVLLDN